MNRVDTLYTNITMLPRKISRGPPELMNIIHKVTDLCNIINFDYVIEFGCEDVDSYADGFYKVTIKGYRDGQKVRKQYVVKWHSEPKRRTVFREAYKREVLFYQKIVPTILKLQTDFKLIEGLKIKFANCDFACAEKDKEAIVISNLQLQGYILNDRFKNLDLDHVSLVMKNLAKLHAFSFVFEKLQPKEFEEIIKTCRTDVQYSDTKQVPCSMASYYKASVNVVEDEVAKKKLQDLASDILIVLNRCAMPDKTKYLTICHGDYWNNNVLFKYQNKRPVDVIFVDCQLIRYTSPVTDLAYFLYMSSDHDFLSNHYDRVATLYYRTLSAVLRQCDLEPNEIYPEQVFLQDLKQYSVIGLIEALISMKIITAAPEEALEMMGMKHEFCEDQSCVDKWQNSRLYVARVNGVVNDFFARNYSLDAVLSK